MASMVNDNHVASSQADTNSDNEDQESNSANMTGTEDEELEEIKARVREMEEEAEKLKQMQDDILASANQSMFFFSCSEACQPQGWQSRWANLMKF